MQVKTFTGTSSQEVLAQIKAEMGSDAVILSNRTYRKNGEFFHEIMAGLDRPSAQPTVPTAQAPAASAPVPSPEQNWGEWYRDWTRIRDQIYALMKPAMRQENLTARQRVALDYLQREGISDSAAIDLYNMLASRPSASVLESLASIVPVKSWGIKEWTQKMHLFAGSFGSGKTTTALRFALQIRQEQPDMQIAFINADCLRGNGRLILRHWAELSDFSYLEAADAEQFRRAMDLATEADIIFVDLPGLALNDNLEVWLDNMDLDVSEAATHLTLCPFFSSIQINTLLKRYHNRSEMSIVWTKLDEAATYGALISVAHETSYPISAISYGSELKESLSPATEPMIWRLIFKRQLPFKVD